MISAFFLLLWILMLLIIINNDRRWWGEDYVVSLMLFSPPIGVLFGFMGITADRKKSLSIISTLVNAFATLLFFYIIPHLMR
jgi:hypothetical protein